MAHRTLEERAYQMHFRFPQCKLKAYHIWKEFRRQKILYKSIGIHKTLKKFDLAESEVRNITSKFDQQLKIKVEE